MYLSDESLEQAREYAKAAFARMEGLSIRPVPTNFCVWYAYHTGKAPELRRAVDILISNRQPFTDNSNDEIYERFFTLGHEQTELRASMVRVQETLSELVSNLGEAGQSTSRYNAALTEISGGIEADPTPGVVTMLVQRLLEETAAIQKKMELLDNQFTASSQTIRQLRDRLEGLRREAHTDSLTGIANRKSFDATLRDAARQSMETGAELSLLFLDIDHFKTFNDTWGHQIGDQALRLVAKTLTDNVKGQDLASRYGGEEFAVILPQTALADAVTLANKIRHAFAVRKLVKKDTGETIGALTVSIGVSRFEPGESLSHFVARADQALYAAKRDGRNRVVAEDALQSLTQMAAAG
ncbi:MAG TPA: GGDEF domain-containing protein [Stellaceae bacterium]|jgi:diguanylate cyclase|nr:GGDEF domain-containing protein [Stellaceae bacterium]